MLVLKYTSGAGVFLHEGGHHLGLDHTQGAGCKDCDTCTSLVSDDIADTLPDRSCWSSNQIAANAFPADYPNLSLAQITQVSNTFNNVMSYHGPDGGTATVLTSDPLDQMADFSRTDRANIMDGKTVFVDRASTSCLLPAGFSHHKRQTVQRNEPEREGFLRPLGVKWWKADASGAERSLEVTFDSSGAFLQRREV